MASAFQDLRLMAHSPRLVSDPSNEFRSVHTDVLRNLWVVRWGGRAATETSVLDADMQLHEVAAELIRRRQLRLEKHTDFTYGDYVYWYVLTKEENADC